MSRERAFFARRNRVGPRGNVRRGLTLLITYSGGGQDSALLFRRVRRRQFAQASLLSSLIGAWRRVAVEVSALDCSFQRQPSGQRRVR